ncbi:MAG TPA: D-aminoacylase [Acidobacteriota bacterium]|nr:D-aminoacylase [Acidobacteriota bacterium]
MTFFFSFTGCRTDQASTFDTVIVNGKIIDGSGSDRFTADVAIVGDTIVRVGRLSPTEKAGATTVINAANLVVSPGFIDIHSHSDFALLVDGTAQSKVHQGVTTEILGESRSAGPIKGKAKEPTPYGIEVDWTTLGEYFDRLEQNGISVNVGSFVGSTQVRLCVLGEDSRKPTSEELEEMKSLVKEAMEEGALGLSSALLVPPNTYQTTHQLIELAKVVRPFGGIYSTHIRTEGEGIQEAIREAIEVGEKGQVPVDVIHLKVADQRLWGKMNEICDLIEEARARGLKVTANQYPYIAGQNNLVALVPPWAMEGGRETMLKLLGKEDSRKRMETDIYNGLPGWFNHYLAMGEWARCMVASVEQPQNEQYEGKSIAQIAQASGKTPTEVVFDLLLEEGGSVPAVYFLMTEEDVGYAMQVPWVSFGSDGSAVRPEGKLGQGNPHPRWYGTFPRILGKYVREEGVISLEEAIRKMTSLNAEKLGITDRGLIAEEKKADLVIFDPEKVADRATFDDPHQYPIGIEYVIVNGVTVLKDGKHLGAKPGRVLRKSSGGSGG